MNWDAIGSVGEILGACGVLITLIYLTIQVRHASNIAWSQKLYAQAAYGQQTMILQKSPEVVAAVEKCYYTNEPLTIGDCIYIESYITSALIDFRTDYLHFEKGLIPEDQWTRRKTTIQMWFGADFPRLWWQMNKTGFEKSFAGEIDELIRTAPDIGGATAEWISEVNRNRTGQEDSGT